MELLPMARLTKFNISMDGMVIASFFHTKDINLHESRALQEEYAQLHCISPKGIRVYKVTNDGKIGAKTVIPHYGRIR